jgi:phage baseplate assembly protein W
MANQFFYESAIALPFKIDPQGNVGKTDDYTKIWQDKVRSVLGTIAGERVYRATFGTNIPKNILGSITDVQETIEKDVARAFSTFLPILVLEDVIVSWNKGSSVPTDINNDVLNGTVSLEVVYSLPNQNKVTTTIGTVSISPTTTITETL